MVCTVRAIELNQMDASIAYTRECWGADRTHYPQSTSPWVVMKPSGLNSEKSDSYNIAAQIAAVAKDGGYDLVLTGKETIDHNGSSIGGKGSRIPDMPYISNASRLDVQELRLLLYALRSEGGEETDKQYSACCLSFARKEWQNNVYPICVTSWV